MSWLSSPLTATVVVCAGLAVIAVPLRKLTSKENRTLIHLAAPVSDDEHDHDHVHETLGILRIKLLAPVKSLRVTTTDGDLLWEVENLSAGEDEVDVDLLLIDDALELRVEADFGEGTEDTALFLTVLPDAIEEQTRYAIGSGSVDEIFYYEWELH